MDLKLHGISPIVVLARGLRARGREPGAQRRWRGSMAAARAGLLDAGDEASTIAEAYRFLPRAAAAPPAPDDRRRAAGRPTRCTLAQLTAIERSRLKDAYRAIRGWQERSAFQLNVDF